MFCWNVASDVGSRNYQEDRHHVLNDVQKRVVVAAVYDGHGNARVSTALADKKIGLAPAIIAWFDKYGKFPESESEAERLFHAVDRQIWAILETDGQESSVPQIEHNNSQNKTTDNDNIEKPQGKKPKKKNKKKKKRKQKLANDTGGGSTAVVAAIDGQKVFFYNVGDSRALLLDADSGNVLLATKDHKPDRVDERARIVSKGGVVKDRHEVARATSRFTEWGYATSRAFGDFEMKRDFTEPLLQAYTDENERKTSRNVGAKIEKDKEKAEEAENKEDEQANLDHDGVMSVTPEVYSTLLDNSVERYFVILASDGLWDVLESEDIADFVASSTESSDRDGEPSNNLEACTSGKENDKLAELLVDKALELGATDNVTVVVLQINNKRVDNPVSLSQQDSIHQTLCLQNMKASISDILDVLDRTDKLLVVE